MPGGRPQADLDPCNAICSAASPDRRSAAPQTMMAAPPHLDAIAESPLKGCALLGSPVLDECEDNKFELFKARIDAADTAYELALEQSRFESRVEARRRASASARASAMSPVIARNPPPLRASAARRYDPLAAIVEPTLSLELWPATSKIAKGKPTVPASTNSVVMTQQMDTPRPDVVAARWAVGAGVAAAGARTALGWLRDVVEIDKFP